MNLTEAEDTDQLGKIRAFWNRDGGKGGSGQRKQRPNLSAAGLDRL
jgi:hypothetical protein